MIGQGVWILWGVENCHLPLTKPVAVNTGLALPRSPWYIHTNLYSAKNRENESEALAQDVSALPLLAGQQEGWLGSRVVSVLDSGAVGPGFKLQPRRCRVTVLGKLFTPIVPLFTGRAGRAPACKNWVVGCWRNYLSRARCRFATAQLMPLPLTVSCFS